MNSFPKFRAALGAAGLAMLVLPTTSPAADATAAHLNQLDRLDRVVQARSARIGTAPLAGSVPSCDGPASVDVRDGSPAWVYASCLYNQEDGTPTLRVTKLPDHGLVDVYTDYRDVQYVSDPGFQGTDTIKYVVSNSAGQTAEQTVTFNVSGTRNSAPDCGYVDGTLETVGEDTVGHVVARAGVARTVSSYCYDPEGDAVSFEIKQQPASGTLTNGAPDEYGSPTLVYTAPADAVPGTKVQATVAGRDEHGLVAEGNDFVIGFEVADPEFNQPPDCYDSSLSSDFWQKLESGEATRAWDAYCYDLEGDAITYSVVSHPSEITATALGDGIEVTPLQGSGSASFTYKGTDALGAFDESSISLHYVTPHVAPSCTGKSVAVAHATRTQFAVTCGDADGDFISVYPVPSVHGQMSTTKHGHLEIGRLTDGQVSFAYLPRGAFTGTDGFKLVSYDQYDDQAEPATVTLNVAAPGSGGGDGGSGGTTTTPVDTTPVITTPVVTPEQAKAAMTTLLTSETLEFLRDISRANKKGIDARKPVLSLGTVGSEQLPNGGTAQFGVFDKPAAKRASISASRKRKSLGSTKVTLAKGQKKAVRVKLNRKGKSLLRKKGKVKLTVDATFTDALTGAKVTRSKTYTFKVKKKRR